MRETELGQAAIALAVLALLAAPLKGQSPAETSAPPIRDVRPPSCFTPGPVRGLAPRGHVYGVFSVGKRFVKVGRKRSPGGPAARAPPARVAAATHDFDRDGRTDTLEVVLLEGRRYDDTTAWCGAGEKFEGRFSVRVHLASGSTSRFPLPEFTFFRAPGGDVVLDDYDGDGRMDFNLGQYGTCSGWRYRLFTVTPSGEIRRLPVGDGSAGWLPVSDFENSTDEITPTAGGFEVCYYDNSATHTVRRYAWDEEAGRFWISGQRPVEGCP